MIHPKAMVVKRFLFYPRLGWNFGESFKKGTKEWVVTAGFINCWWWNLVKHFKNRVGCHTKWNIQVLLEHIMVHIKVKLWYTSLTRFTKFNIKLSICFAQLRRQQELILIGTDTSLFPWWSLNWAKCIECYIILCETFPLKVVFTMCPLPLSTSTQLHHCFFIVCIFPNLCKLNITRNFPANIRLTVDYS